MITKYQSYYANVAHHIAGRIFGEEGRHLSDEERFKLTKLSVKYYKNYLLISDSGRNLFNTNENAPLYSIGGVFRNAGVMAAMLAKLEGERNNLDGEMQANTDMFKLWEVFIVKCWLENRMDEKDCKEVEVFISKRINPHSGMSLGDREEFQWLDKRFGPADTGRRGTSGNEGRLKVNLSKRERKWKKKRQAATSP